MKKLTSIIIIVFVMLNKTIFPVFISTQPFINTIKASTENTDINKNKKDKKQKQEEEVTSTPISIPTLIPTPILTPTPTPINPDIIDSEIPIEKIEIKDKFIPSTLKNMKEYDYVTSSTTGDYISQMTLKEMNKKYQKYGSLHTEGMPYKEYVEAMTYEWEDCTEYEKEPEPITIDIKKTINYDTYIDVLQKLSRYDGVYLYKIGESYEGRDLYAIEIDIESDAKKNVYMLTGQIHAREFAGGTFITKMLVDLIQDAQINKKAMKILKNNKFVAVPIINVDGREALIDNPSKWTDKQGEMLKAYTNKVDGNRNFPGLMCGQLSKGNKLKWNISKKPALFNYAGDYVGSNPETKALMKWLYHYIVIEQAVCLLDLHQQGSVVYAGKGWATNEQNKYSSDLRTKMFSHLNKGNKRTYGRIKDEPKYGLEGTNSTLTDYAISIACGSKFSPEHGFHVISDDKSDMILMQFNDLDNLNYKIDAPNIKFATLTIEIGVGKKYLGNSSTTRNNLNNEYSKYHFDTLLYNLPSMTD